MQLCKAHFLRNRG